MQIISSISRCVTRIEARRIYDDGQEHNKFAVASGFVWRFQDRHFIVTNWHNVTGVDPNTEKALNSFIPTHFDIYFKYKADERDGKDLIVGRRCRIALHDKTGSRRWLEHEEGRAVDVVAIPIDDCVNDGMAPFALNDVDLENRWNPEVAADCYIVGYPEGLVGGLDTPIWKRGSIATEPMIDHDSLPLVLVDTLGNPGLSGAPVIAQASGIFLPHGGPGVTPGSYVGTWQNFFGIYSGRVGDEGLGFQLGRVWKSKVINEILKQ